MDRLEEMQLRTEALKAEVDARQDLFGTPPEKENLRELLKASEDYLPGLLRNYEDKYADRQMLAATDLFPIGSELTDFIKRAGEEAAVMKYYDAIAAARKFVVRLIEQSTPSP